MPPVRVDFYLLGSSDKQTALQFACRLLEKAYLRGHQVFVFCNDRQEAESLDELLWTFKDDSFIPHNLQGEGPEPPPVIQIGYQQEPRGFHDILLNLSDEIPAFFTKFKRVIELVVDEEQAKTLSRSHFRQYRSANCEINTHNV
ncbi:DNA polymerase III subunit chi [Legionella quinlivanii]|uniref:DNA polymerase III subunit chi n=1 Tax=Legionella quinlivanii TaxID=45073 RepID=A0A0W0Y080_9GAMM|nr:DNA polymerase III subunit chi [Legionella quinlivanii]KTD50218.1 DNA polymerase III subunit chi [Legionella quinlivanii]MCW8450037.1 DNA polymerase III subunit chi [Legionella quinlivanii]SEF47107.1 DNA polymerase III, chi subunit [Legionella quinlivanii DSM 21216]STY11816.1 DNA polymerase III subunit chi [Legionella quinlivanii]